VQLFNSGQPGIILGCSFSWRQKVQSSLFFSTTVCVQVTSKQGIDVKRSPSLPFMTSTMLTAAANQLGSDVARTMANAQVLFEGGEVGQSCFLSKTKSLRFSAVIAGASSGGSAERFLLTSA